MSHIVSNVTVTVDDDEEERVVANYCNNNGITNQAQFDAAVDALPLNAAGFNAVKALIKARFKIS